MPSPERFGRTRIVEIRDLPPLEFDLSEGEELPAVFGKTEAPVRELPDLEFDFDDAEPVLTLQLTLSLREGEKPAANKLALNLFQLYAAVNQLEVSAGGAGLTLDETSCDESASDGTIRVYLKPTDPRGAVERLQHLVEQINQAPADVPIPAPFERCEARIAA